MPKNEAGSWIKLALFAIGTVIVAIIAYLFGKRIKKSIVKKAKGV